MSALTPIQRQDLDRKVMQSAMAHMRDRGGYTIKREDIAFGEAAHGHKLDPSKQPRVRE